MQESGVNSNSIDVIVCVHNSPDDVSRCLESARRTLRDIDQLIIVDDGSDDETRVICEAVADQHPSVMLLRRPQGSGFCRAANAGLRESSAPTVVLLNSDTIVPSGWLDRIAACMEANWQIGVVGPLSNAGGWQSIPEYKTGGPPNNLIRDDLATITDIQRYCSSFLHKYEYPIVEQVNGFCFAISREVLHTVGPFDEEHFPMGYGEEVDLTLRAQDAGFLCAIAIDCFVYHAKTKSYSTKARSEYIKKGRIHLDRIHGAGRVAASVKNTQENPILAAIRSDAFESFKRNNWLLK